MLTLKERHGVLKCLYYFSALSLLPIRVDLQAWKVHPGCGTKYRTWACGLSYALFGVQALYKNLSLACAFIFPCEVPLHQIMIHGDVAGASAMLAFWYYVSYIKFPGFNAMLWRLTLTGNVTKG